MVIVPPARIPEEPGAVVPRRDLRGGAGQTLSLHQSADTNNEEREEKSDSAEIIRFLSVALFTITTTPKIMYD